MSPSVPTVLGVISIPLRHRESPSAPRVDTVPAAPAPAPGRHHRRHVGLAAVGVVVGLVAVAAGVVGATWVQMERSVHHVALSPRLLAAGSDDVLVDVWRPGGQVDTFVYRASGAAREALSLPAGLVVGGTGRHTTLGSIPPGRAAEVVSAVRQAGVPVGRYVGLNLSTVAPSSPLGQVASGHVPLSSLLNDPAAAAGLLADAAHHVFLGPGTSLGSVLSAVTGPAPCRRISLPAAHRRGQAGLVPTARSSQVVAAFLSPRQAGCRHAR